jgi:hypothetical protein
MARAIASVVLEGEPMLELRTTTLRAYAIVLILAATTPFSQSEERGNQKKPPAAPAKVKPDAAADTGEKAAAVGRARQLAKDVVDSKEIEDKIEAARMKADFGALLCRRGDGDVAAHAFRGSLEEVLNKLEDSSEARSRSGQLIQLAIDIAAETRKCDPKLADSIMAGFPKNNSAGKDGSGSDASPSPQIVPDPVFGTKPSIQRQLRAAIAAREAYAAVNSANPDRAILLLDESAGACVMMDLAAPLGALAGKGRQESAYEIYLRAARQVQALPSGMEAYSLRFVLSGLVGFRSPLFTNPDSADASKAALAAVYVDALYALVTGPDSSAVAKAPQMVKLVSDSLPLLSKFRQPAIVEVTSWLAQAGAGLPPDRRAAIQAPSGVAEQPISDSALEAAMKSDDLTERDEAYSYAANSNMAKGKFDEALRLASNISDRALKTESLDSIRNRKAQFSIARGDDPLSVQEEISAITSPILRARLLTELADRISKNRPLLASEFLTEAAALARKLDEGAIKTRLLLRVAGAFIFDRVMALSMFNEAVKSINRQDAPPPTRWSLRPPPSFTVTKVGKLGLPKVTFEDEDDKASPYDLSALRAIAIADLDGAFLLAQSITNKSLSAAAKYEICAGVLEGPHAPASGREIPK